MGKMLNATIARNATALVPAIEAEIERNLANGRCRHGIALQAWDCACWMCEADDATFGVYVRQTAIARARASVRAEAVDNLRNALRPSEFSLTGEKIEFALFEYASTLHEAGYDYEVERLRRAVGIPLRYAKPVEFTDHTYCSPSQGLHYC